MKNQSLILLAFFFIAGFFEATAVNAQEIHACVVMPGQTTAPQIQQSSGYNLPAGVQKAVALGNPSTNGFNSSNFWTAGSTIRVQFMGGTSYMRQQVLRYANEWTQYANINFAAVNSGVGDIRISFVQNGSSWSTLGRQARYVPANQATMNFGWLTNTTPDYEFRRTVLHEFGHALGLLHEHQNPSGGIPWDEEQVYAFYYRTQGWDRATTYHNVIARQQHDETQYSDYDQASIMHYPIDPRLTRGGYEVGLNTAISPTDAKFIAQIYPGRRYTPPTTSTAPPSRSNPEPVTSTKPVKRPENRSRRPAVVTHEVTISNKLGRDQQAEVIELYIAGQKHVFSLHKGRRSAQAIRLNLKPGVYDYKVNTASIYTVLRRVLENGRYVEKRANETIHGNGEGQLRITGNGELSFYGNYDREKGRMKVYLAAAK